MMIACNVFCVVVTVHIMYIHQRNKQISKSISKISTALG